MSSLRNAVKRRPYKERSQPQKRSHLGLLEKHKDYVERAQNYNKKQQRLKVMREKAAMRNPEEFYYAMVNTQTKNGVHQAEREKALPTRVVRHLKGQDAVYLEVKAAEERKRLERLRSCLHGLGAAKPNAHTIFVENDTEAARFDPAEHFGTLPAMADRTFNRPRREKLGAGSRIPLVMPEGVVDGKPAALDKWVARVEKASQKSYGDLERVANRERKIRVEMARVKQQRDLFGKGAKRKKVVVHDDGDGRTKKTVVYKRKKERQR